MEPIGKMQATGLAEPENYQQKMLEAWQKFITKSGIASHLSSIDCIILEALLGESESK